MISIYVQVTTSTHQCYDLLIVRMPVIRDVDPGVAQSILFQLLEATRLTTYCIQGRLFEGLHSRENRQVYD